MRWRKSRRSNRASLNYLVETSLDTGHIPPMPDSEDGGWNARDMVRMREALAIEQGDSGVVVGLIDSGVNGNHPELADCLRAGFDTVRLSSSDVADGIELLGDHSDLDMRPRDHFVGHGMGCAGIIAGKGRAHAARAGRSLPDPADARARRRADCPTAKYVGIGAISDLDLARQAGGRFGCQDHQPELRHRRFARSQPNSPKPHADTVAYAIARGCILIAASGNNGRETRYWPAAFPEVIAVGAVSEARVPAGFSTRGEHVALCAPGQKVLTSAVEGYQMASGTSFAAPFVTAAAALLVARSHARSRPIDGVTVRRLLAETAQPFAGLFSWLRHRDPRCCRRARRA